MAGFARFPNYRQNIFYSFYFLQTLAKKHIWAVRQVLSTDAAQARPQIPLGQISRLPPITEPENPLLMAAYFLIAPLR
jgi:hypothetical protein